MIPTALRIFDVQDKVQKGITSDIEDPRDVAVDANRIYVLDKNGIAVFAPYTELEDA